MSSCGCGSSGGGGDTIVRGSGRVSVSGSGSASDPYIIAQGTDSATLQLEVRDTATVNMTLFGSGSPQDPYIIRADTSSASSLKGLSDVSATPTVSQGAVPLWIGSAVGGHFEFRTPGTRYTSHATRGFGLYQGEVIKETDTGTRFEWDGSQWVDLTPTVIPPTALSPTIVQDAGTLAANVDWNTLTGKAGVYRIGGWNSNVNAPPGAYNFGTLMVLLSGQSVTHVYYEHGSNALQWNRTKWNATDWTPWKQQARIDDTNYSNGLIAQEVSDRKGAFDYTNGRITQEVNDRSSQVQQLRTDATNGDNGLSSRIGNIENDRRQGLGFNMTNGAVNSGIFSNREGKSVTWHISMKTTQGFGINGIGTIITGITSPPQGVNADFLLRRGDDQGSVWATMETNGNLSWRPGGNGTGTAPANCYLYGSVSYVCN